MERKEAEQDVREGVVAVEQAEIHYELWGAGEPLVLLHGFTGCAGDFVYAGRDVFARHYKLIVPDARGHGASTNGLQGIRHDQCARDTLALLDHLGLERVRAVGLSMGGNVLLHMATLDPERIEAMVLVSATLHFPEQARAVMRALPSEHSEEEWEIMRARHRGGDAQIERLWQAQRDFQHSVDDMCFSADDLARIRARTLVYYGDQDPLYPLSMAEAMAGGISGAELRVVAGGHCPVFLEASGAFVDACLPFFRG